MNFILELYYIIVIHLLNSSGTMSLPKQLYDIYREICNCSLLTSDVVTDQNIAEFETLLNKAQLQDQGSIVQRAFTKSIYNSNQEGFYKYVLDSRNRVGALVLWTEGKRIVRYFGLQGIIHIGWNFDKEEYVVSRHVRREPKQDESKVAEHKTDKKTKKLLLKDKNKDKKVHRENTRFNHLAKNNGQWVSKSTSQMNQDSQANLREETSCSDEQLAVDDCECVPSCKCVPCKCNRETNQTSNQDSQVSQANTLAVSKPTWADQSN